MENLKLFFLYFTKRINILNMKYYIIISRIVYRVFINDNIYIYIYIYIYYAKEEGMLYRGPSLGTNMFS